VVLEVETPVAFIQVRPPGHFKDVSITTPVVSALKKVPADILNHFWIQVAVSELKRTLRHRFGSETVTSL
jgi:hypothetical protein